MLSRIAAVTVALCLSHATYGQLLSIADRRDHVYDPVTKILYISTDSGNIQRYSTATSSFLSPWSIGGNLRGIDVTPDGSTLLVTVYDNGNLDPAKVHRVNTATGAFSTFTMELNHTWDVVALNNNRAIITGQRSNWHLMQEWDLATNTIVPRTDPRGMSAVNQVRDGSWLFRNGSGSAMLGLETNISSAPTFTYSPQSNTFAAGEDMSYKDELFTFFHTDGVGSVNRTGSLMAFEFGPRDQAVITDGTASNILKLLSNVDGGMIFDPTRDWLITLDVDLDQVVIYNTNTWAEIKRIAAGTNIRDTTAYDQGVTSIDAANNTLFVSVTGGIQRINGLPEPILGLPAVLGLLALRRPRVR